MMMTAFEKDLFVAVISEENDTGKETIGNLHNIVIHLYEQAFEILRSQYGKINMNQRTERTEKR